MKELVSPKEAVLEFERFIVSEYLRYGSVDEIFRQHNDRALGISYPGVYHVLNRWGVVRGLGRTNTPLTESIEFLVRKIEKKIPLGTLYRSTPPSFRPSMATLHTIYRWAKRVVKEEIEKRDMRRAGTALFVTPHLSPNLVLLGRDTAPPRLDVGKPYGAISLPMGFSKSWERKRAALRVLQQEVFTNKLIENPASFNETANQLIDGLDPFMFLDIADVRVSVYHLELPRELSSLENFSSFKLKNFRFERVEDVLTMSQSKYLLRLGIEEIATGYLKYQERLAQGTTEPFYMDSFFNQRLALLVANQESV
ncbi:MAG: hypothetical protein UW60_C0049G0005 [Candidatus Woesebacteria bacterium GW2011_GWA2_44_33]|uniref:Uncharacterized protein n=1 Tax=Candidatus Woesebacteria bacterium GW2011_GWA2_44_33 TaxID=1618564 RepID=A0A0G1L8L7_9BACT|nr:MAG: hypothetical protein UW60_C0049G0005 [Candidatus Woesebacteria bacterium GW2011_GWA2_44_33]